MSKFRIQHLGLAVTLVAVGCATEQPPRSYVQPNIIRKTDLLGTDPNVLATWHYVQTVIDAPPTNGSAFVGLSSEMMKIRFLITEDYVYATRAFEHIENSEDYWWRDPLTYTGAPLAAWRIQSHFDIIRDYNSTTGEQTNKIIESTERPWQQREFMRVKWDTNEVTDFVGLGLNFFFSDGQPQIQSVSYWESDPTKPDAMHWDRAPKDIPAEGFKQSESIYFDITNQVIVTPDMYTLTYEEGGQQKSLAYPKCFFYYMQDDCASQKVKIRHAFAKIGPNHDVQPRDWDGNQMNLFGVWDVGLRRLTYNRQYGVTNSGFKRHAARFNIWKKSYNGTELIPYKDREVRTIPYYAEGSQPIVVDQGGGVMAVELRYPEDLYPQFQEIIKQWDDAMRGMLTSLVPEKYPTAAMAPHVFIPCHNPVLLRDTKDANGNTVKADDKGCVTEEMTPDTDASGVAKKDKNGDPIYTIRQGDPRRSNVFWVNQQQNSGPLGYGPGKYDEETGETISGQAYIYGAALDTYAARARDLMLLQNGDVQNSDFVAGTDVQDYVAKVRLGTNIKPETYEPSQVAAMMTSMDFGFAKAFTVDKGYPAIDTSSNTALRTSLDIRDRAIYQGHFDQATKTNVRQDNLRGLSGSTLEHMMITNENLAEGGISPSRSWDELAPLERHHVSPIRRQMIEDAALKERIKAETMGVDFATFDDAGLEQRVRVYRRQYCPSDPENCELIKFSEDMRKSLRGDIYLAVTLHEVGHNMGMRHNFRASYDSMNYFPQYWKIRNEAMDNPDPGMGAKDGKLHPRWVNKAGGAVTDYELDKGVREFQYSSIMDYGGDFNSDLYGLGLYDKAFIKFSYGELLEVFTDAKPEALVTIGSLHTFQNALGFPSPLGTGAGLSAINYTSYPDLFNSGTDGIYMRADVPRSQVSTQPADMNGNTFIADDQGRPLVPYYFCSDEFAGNLTCQRFDAGPDTYEQATDIISRYQNYYLLNNYKRDRQSFHTGTGYYSRIASRYFNMLRQQLTWYVLLRADFEAFNLNNCNINNMPNCNDTLDVTHAFLAREDGWGSFTLSVAKGFELLGQTLTTPTMGLFFKADDGTGQKYWKQFRDDTFDGQGLPGNVRRVSYIDGKYVDTRWDQTNCGYYWSEDCQQRIGYMIDKQIALDVLSESQAYFTGRDTNVDQRQYAIGYIIPFKKQIEEKFGSILAGDVNAYAPMYFQKSQEWFPKQRSWVFDNPGETPNLERIDPSTGFTIQLYAGLYGLASFPTTFDHDFIDHTQIFVVGNGESSVSEARILADGTSDPTQLVANGGNKTWFLYEEPQSGKVFAAHSVPAAQGIVQDPENGNTGNKFETKTVPLRVDTGVRMLQRLQALGAVLVAAQGAPPNDPHRDNNIEAAQSAYDLYRQNIEVMRSLHHRFGYGQYRGDAPFVGP